MRSALMEVCAEFEHAHGDSTDTSAQAARARIQELRVKARQIQREMDTFGDTDGFGVRVAKASHRSTPSTRTTSGRVLPHQFDLKEKQGYQQGSVAEPEDSARDRSTQAESGADPFEIMSGLLAQMQDLELDDERGADDAAIDIDRMAKEAEARLKSGKLPGVTASAEEAERMAA